MHLLPAFLSPVAWHRLRESSVRRCGRDTSTGGRRWAGHMSCCAWIYLFDGCGLASQVAEENNNSPNERMLFHGTAEIGVSTCITVMIIQLSVSFLFSLTFLAFVSLLPPLPTSLPLSPSLPKQGSPFLHHIIMNGFDERHAYIGGMFGAGTSLHMCIVICLLYLWYCICIHMHTVHHTHDTHTVCTYDSLLMHSGIYFAENSSKSNQYVYGIAGGNGCPTHKDKSCYVCARSESVA